MFTMFLEDDKKSTATNSALKTTTNTPKLYRRSREIQAYRISLLIALIIVLISLIINFMFLIPPKKTSTVSQGHEVVAIDEAVLSEFPPTSGEPAKPTYQTMLICSSTSTFKSWMDYRKITSQSSRQWKLQQTASTDEYGFRLVGEYYMVAMAKQYGPVGTKYLITFSGGQQMPVIIGDVKGGTTCTHPDSSMIELIVDSTRMPYNVKDSGNYNSMIEGSITEIRVVEDTE